MFDAGSTGSEPVESKTTAPSTAAATHDGARSAPAKAGSPATRSFVDSCPVTTPGRRRADRTGVETWAGSGAGTTDTTGGSPRSAVWADDVATQTRRTPGTTARSVTRAARRRRPARRD